MNIYGVFFTISLTMAYNLGTVPEAVDNRLLSDIAVVRTSNSTGPRETLAGELGTADNETVVFRPLPPKRYRLPWVSRKAKTLKPYIKAHYYGEPQEDEEETQMERPPTKGEEKPTVVPENEEETQMERPPVLCVAKPTVVSDITENVV